MLIRNGLDVTYYCDERNCGIAECVEGNPERPRHKLRPGGWLLLTSRRDRRVCADLCQRCTGRFKAGVISMRDIMFSEGRLVPRRYAVVRKGERHAG